MVVSVWNNKNMSLFDLTDRDRPTYLFGVGVRSILKRRLERSVVTLVAPMPNEWLWNFNATALEVLQRECADPSMYNDISRIIELSNCNETHRYMDDIVLEPFDEANVILLVVRVECEVRVIFERAKHGA